MTTWAAVLCVIGAAFALAALYALARARPMRFVVRTLLALLFLVPGLGLGALAIAVDGLRAFTREATAARIVVRPDAPQRYHAVVRFADGHEESYDLAGDDIVVDAHIIKWTPLANRLGLDTSYRLERISGRYHSVDDETKAHRTVYALGTPPRIDLVAWARKLPLAPLFDAEYGSATFVPVVGPATFDLQVSNSGLLFRRVDPPPS